MRKENLYFNSRCCSPQGSGNLKSLSNYFGLAMMSSSGPHKIALLVGSLHLAITGQWLPHTTRPSFQSRILKGWKHCSRLLFISLTQKQYLQFERVCLSDLQFYCLDLAWSMISFIDIDKVALLIPNQCSQSCSTPQQILGQR